MNYFYEKRVSDSPFVRDIWRAKCDGFGQFIASADESWDIILRKDKRTAVLLDGPNSHVQVIAYGPYTEYLGISFRPGVFMHHLPGKIMVNTTLELPQAANGSFWLEGAKWQFPDYDNAESLVDKLVKDGLLERDRVVEAAMRGESPEASPRAVQYHFLHTTGLTHSQVRQIARARQATELLRQGASILDVVHQAGYSDQPHLTKSLKRFVGQTPGQIL